MKLYFLFILFISIFIGIIYKLFYIEKEFTILKLKDFINSTVYPNSILVAEYQRYHLECLPGFTKYFIDLGYNVDIILYNNLSESMKKFRPLNRIRIFEYNSIKEIEKNLRQFKEKLKQYKFLFLETLEKHLIPFYEKVGYYNNPNSLFVIHHVDERYLLGINNSISKNRVFSLTDYGIIPYLNPNYYGNFKLSHEKNQIVSFFITSTKLRNYQYFIEGVSYLKNKSIDFIINVVGRCGNFTESNVPIELKKYFKFYGTVEYQKMYNIVKNSDFIILNLYPDNETDNLFRTFRATGNAQLAYGFYKPVLIEENFVKVYKFSKETAIIYKGHNISSAMLIAATMSKSQYKDMSRKVKYLKETIYNLSLNNLKKVLYGN